jgi:hypothetical protein
MLSARIRSILTNTICGFAVTCCPIAGTVPGIGQVHADFERLLSIKFVGTQLVTRFQDLAGYMRSITVYRETEC